MTKQVVFGKYNDQNDRLIQTYNQKAAIHTLRQKLSRTIF